MAVTAASWSLANPAGLALLGLAVPVIILHILRPRRQAVTVSSTFLWRAIARPVTAATPWQKLRWSALLAAQLLVVALLALAVAKPVTLRPATLSGHTVFIVDASASMRATDGAPDRLAAAVARSVELRRQLPTGGVASIVVAGASPRVALTASDDSQAFADALRTIDAEAGSADFAEAFSLAESLDTGTAPIGFVLLSDGGLTDDDQQQLPPGTRYERVGRDATNRSVERIDVEPRGSGLHARITVRNHGTTAVRESLRIDVDEALAVSRDVPLGAASSAVVEVDLPAGERVAAHLGGGDLLTADDTGVAVANRRPPRKVLVVGSGRFWTELLTSIPGVTVERAEVLAGEVAPDGSGYDVVVYDGVAVPPTPKAAFLAVAAPGGVPGAPAQGVAERPAVTLLRSDDPLLAGIDLSSVAIAQAQRLTPDASVEVLVAGERTPLLVRGVVGGHRFAALTFTLADSNLPVQVAFPLLGDRLLTELSGLRISTERVDVGDALALDPAAISTIGGPAGERFVVPIGDPSPATSSAGFWTISVDGRADRLVAVNPPIVESAVTPRAALNPSDPGALRPTSTAQLATSLLPWVLGALLVLLAIEGWLAWRRLGVSRRQWRLAVAARLVIAALLVGALVAPMLRRTSDRQATVFLLDRSASLGTAGSAAAQKWLLDALAKRPGEAHTAVVVFGAEARLDRVLQQSSVFDGSAVVIDSAATDIASAMRLGAAVLPSDARRRLVLISDGRATSGDTANEAVGLADAGIPVDVLPIDVVGSADAAVASIDVPRLARVGDKLTITAHVAATSATRATAVLRRDGVDLATQAVDLKPGDNVVTFTDTAATDAGAMLRYQVTVLANGDTQSRNDSAFAAVPVDGPARVLVVEGQPNESATLSKALQAGGVGTTVIGPSDLPGVKDLATYAGIILVDVAASQLNGTQIANLTTTVRDLGRGLVTVGGPRSYGVGGYRESPLNDLLPVDSEILDPKRRKTVAEVLSIDTSGSMANCHCREGQLVMGADSVAGGVDKTAISRAAAERAIKALTANDEVGVLAWNSTAAWALELQRMPTNEVIANSLAKLRPDGNTNMLVALRDAAAALKASAAELKHIIVFTDGFTSDEVIKATEREAGELFEEFGISVSVLGTGEGAAPALARIAAAGHGRFYPGTDLAAVPQIMAQEAVIASRDFINEGSFLPEVTSNDRVVADLTSAPPLLGYVATTTKGTASTLMRIGPDRDPLLATWQAGLGRVSSWTSDGADGWAKQWASWNGYVDFWNRLVKSTFQTGDTLGAAQATIADGTLLISVEGSASFPDLATATAVVAGPDGQRLEIPLTRTSGATFEGQTAVQRSGTYAVGTKVEAGGATVLASSTLANDSYPAEFAPGATDLAMLERLAQRTGGRMNITAAQAFETAGLRAGTRPFALAGPFLLAATLLWPLAVALSRLSLRGATAAGARAGLFGAARRARARLPRLGAPDPHNAPAPPRPAGARGTRPPSPPPDAATGAASEVASDAPPPRRPAGTPPAGEQRPSASRDTVTELLERQRRRRGGGEPPPAP